MSEKALTIAYPLLFGHTDVALLVNFLNLFNVKSFDHLALPPLAFWIFFHTVVEVFCYLVEVCNHPQDDTE